MTEAPFNAAQVGVTIARALEDRHIPYALGGALAYGVWALPRATRDVDINVFLAPEELGPALDALASASVTLDRDSALREAQKVKRRLSVGV